jgi:hypothetical protein
MQGQRPRPAGYSTVAPVRADTVVRRLRRLNCGDWTGGMRTRLEGLGIRYITFHRGLFGETAAVPERSWFAWNGLLRLGFHPTTTGGAVTLFEAGSAKGAARLAPMLAPRKPLPVYCGGWDPPAKPHAKVRTMSASHSSIWVNGSGTLSVLASSAVDFKASFAVDGKPIATRKISYVTAVRLPLRGFSWHLVTIDIPHLRRAGAGSRPIGLDVVVVHRGVKIVP